MRSSRSSAACSCRRTPSPTVSRCSGRPTSTGRSTRRSSTRSSASTAGASRPTRSPSSDELGKRGDLGRVGGQAYLHQLISSVPTAANAGYYAQIVAERAVLRRLVEAGTKIVQLGYAQGGGDVEDIVNAAQAEVYAVVDKRGGEDYHRLGDILEMTVDEIEVASGKSGEMTGVPTGFTDLDSLTNGLHPGQMIVLAARPAIGKALALDTRLPTPFGWTTMGDVAVGDLLLGADGRPTRVVAATDVMVERPCYRVCFSDGTSVIADAHHQWVTTTRASRRAAGERRPPSFYWSPESRRRLAEAPRKASHVARCAGLSERGPRRGRARVPDRLQHRGEDDHPSGKGGAPRERNAAPVLPLGDRVLQAGRARGSDRTYVHSCRVVGGRGPLRRQDDRGDRGERSVRGRTSKPRGCGGPAPSARAAEPASGPLPTRRLVG